MNEALLTVLRRLAGAVELVEARLRALELVAASGNERFVALAVDDLERARERLASLELTRCVAMVELGLDADVSARELLELSGSHHPEAASVVEQLTDAYAKAEDARNRVRQVMSTVSARQRARIDASRVLADRDEHAAVAPEPIDGSSVTASG